MSAKRTLTPSAIASKKQVSLTSVRNRVLSRYTMLIMHFLGYRIIDHRFVRSGSINRSLSAIGNVIQALVDNGQGKKRHVPYRDSTLSFLLRDSLGGNTKTYIVACVHPGLKTLGESLSTLRLVPSLGIMDVFVCALWSKIEKNTDKIAIQSFTVPRARE